MKHQQICPWCGEELSLKEMEEVYAREMRYHKRYYVEYKKCNLCRKPLVDKKQCTSFTMYLIIAIPLGLLLGLGLAMLGIKLGNKYFDGESDFLMALIELFFAAIITELCYIYSLISHKSEYKYQRFVAYDNNYTLIILKSDFTAIIFFSNDITNKQRKKEFVKDNILQISANGESEYIILTKADFETGNCQATFPVLKKENGLALLEKYSEFELSNGEEVLGTLKVEKVFEA